MSAERGRAQRIVEAPLRLRSFILKQPVITSTLLPAMPRSMRWALRKAYFFPYDLVDRVSGMHDDLVPPKSLIYDGGVDGYKRGGQIVLRQLIELSGLQPDDAVLDVGCGLGRQAVALTGYLSATGRYEGLDIVPHGIQWCSDHITPKFPRFRFQLANIYNKEYNPGGTRQASEYTFPYPDESFDLVFLTSVFTHMLPVDVEHYVSEIARVLKPRGRCHATFFLLNETSRSMMATGRSVINFKYDLGTCSTASPRVPELSIAFDEDFAVGLFRRYGLGLKRSVYYGGWDGRNGDARLSMQDIITATKPSGTQESWVLPPASSAAVA